MVNAKSQWGLQQTKAAQSGTRSWISYTATTIGTCTVPYLYLCSMHVGRSRNWTDTR